MFVRKKKYPSGNIGIIIVEKIGGKMKVLALAKRVSRQYKLSYL